MWSSTYDIILPPESSQSQVFNFVQSSIDSVSKGFNCTILAYGQTGSGKTYTMFGANWESNNPAPQVYYDQKSLKQSLNPSFTLKSGGLIPKSIMQLFQNIESKPVTIYCSFLQIYNEKIFDLLQNSTRDKALNIREEKDNGIFVENLAEYVVEKAEDCIYLLKQGDKNRIVRQTKFNHHSSRSHTIFQLLVEGDKANKRGVLKRAKLNLCDLAGSEKFDKEGRMLRDHIQEMNSINKSLTTLGKVISALGAGNQSHVPYRESKLTRLLQDSLGVTTRTILIATISPARNYVDESINTLKFADRAKQVMVRVTKNEISATNDSLVTRLQREIQHLRSLLSISKKGNMQEISKELLALKEENERLKKITKSLTVEEVEILKQENKKLRIELQNIREKSETNESFWDEGKISSTKDSKASNSREVREASPLVNALENWKTKEMEEAVESIKVKMTNTGRCPVCTLKLPCKHYESPSELPKIQTRNISLPPCGKKNLNESARDFEPRNFSIEQPRKLSFRTRAKNSYNEEPAALSEWKEEKIRRNKLKETEARLIKLSKIEAYREEKLKKELENLERERAKEEEEYLKQQQKELKTKKYLDTQRKKLEEFQKFKEQEFREMRDKIAEEEENKRRKEEKKRKYLEEQKRKISEFQSKKKMMEEVTMDQIEELCKIYTAKEVLTKKHFTFKRTEELS